MAVPHACRSLCRNFFFTGKDKLAGVASIEGGGTPISILIVSHALTFALATTPTIAPSLDNELFKQFIKAYLEAQVPGQTEVDPKPCKQPLKAQFPDLYYSNLHINCYQFCQQCKDHFETAGAKWLNKILFAALFLRGLVIQQWLQHKQHCDKVVLMT